MQNKNTKPHSGKKTALLFFVVAGLIMSACSPPIGEVLPTITIGSEPVQTNIPQHPSAATQPTPILTETSLPSTDQSLGEDIPIPNYQLTSIMNTVHRQLKLTNSLNILIRVVNLSLRLYLLLIPSGIQILSY